MPTITIELTVDQSWIVRTALATAARDAKAQQKLNRTVEDKYMTDQVINHYKQLDSLICDAQKELLIRLTNQKKP